MAAQVLSTVVAYAAWLAEQPGPRSDKDFEPIIQRLGFRTLDDIATLVGDSSVTFDEMFPVLDPVKFNRSL